MSGASAELIEEAQKHKPHKWPKAQRDEKPYCDYCSTAWPCITSRLADALEAATAYEMFAVLGTDKDGDDWITADKYDDIESAQAYSKLFGGTAHRCSVGEWIAVAK